MHSTKTIFVTTGATVTFPALIRAVLQRDFIKSVEELGYSKLSLQYGKGEDGIKLFKRILKNELSLEIRLTRNTEGIEVYESQYKDGFIVEGFAFSNNINKEISSADLVISHSGTGSILDSLRLRKKLIVVVNVNLMDNHQLEIAGELEKGGFLLKCDTPDVKALTPLMEEIQNKQLTELPVPKENVLKEILQSF